MDQMKPIPLHIPKTGGGSLSKILGIGDIGHRRKVRNMRAFIPTEMYLFGFLRCPLDRAVSTYHFLVQAPDMSLQAGPKRRGLHVAHLFLPAFVSDVNEFWSKATMPMFGPIHVMQPQRLWVTGGPIEKFFNAYDFGQFDSEIDRLMVTLGREREPLKRKIHATKRGTVAEELDSESVSRIKQLYKDDFRLLDRYGIPHGG